MNGALAEKRSMVPTKSPHAFVVVGSNARLLLCAPGSGSLNGSSQYPVVLVRHRRPSLSIKNISAIAGVVIAFPLLAIDVASPADQIASAVLAAPEDRRAGATVLGYNAKGEVETLRKGTNDMICLADDPAEKGLSVACYHKDLEPFMARGRELAKTHKGKERHEARWKEVNDGKVKMPREARMLYVMTGTAFDSAKGELTDSYLRWVVYVPYATPESTGLTTKAGPAPWLMYPGTAGAHIMISPPKK
jgi:hypothetical protein